MAAVFGLNECNVGISQNLLAGFGKDANEGIVGSVQDESGNCDPVTTCAAEERS